MDLRTRQHESTERDIYIDLANRRARERKRESQGRGEVGGGGGHQTPESSIEINAGGIQFRTNAVYSPRVGFALTDCCQ